MESHAHLISPFEHLIEPDESSTDSTPFDPTAIAAARSRVKQSFLRSVPLQSEEYVFPRLDVSELELGRQLGHGSFGTVLEILGLKGCDEEGRNGLSGRRMSDGEVRLTKSLDGLGESNEARGLDLGLESRDYMKEGRASLTFVKGEFYGIFRKQKKSKKGNGLKVKAEGNVKSRPAHVGSSSHDCLDERKTSMPVVSSDHHGMIHDLVHSHGIGWSRAKEDNAKQTRATLTRSASHDYLDERKLSFPIVSGEHHGIIHDHMISLPFLSGKHHGLFRSHTKEGDAKHTRATLMRSVSHDCLDDRKISLPSEHHGMFRDHKFSSPIVRDNKKSLPSVSGKPHVIHRRLSLTFVSGDNSRIVPKQTKNSRNKDAGDKEVGHTRKDQEIKQVVRNPNFSFVSWRDSAAGQEGRNAVEVTERTFIRSWIGECDEANDASELTTERQENQIVVTSPVVDNELPDHSNDPTQPSSVPSTRRQIVLYSKTNDGVNVSFDDGDSTIPPEQDRRFIAKHALNSEGIARYAIKIISPKVFRGGIDKFVQAATDFASETYFFSVLHHKNVLKMRAVGQGDMFSPDYFLVLDRLFDTLDNRIRGIWKTQLDQLVNSTLVWNRARKLKALLEERLIVARDLADAVSYLHDTSIIYRDLKPENIGFDGRGIAKLFDFGLAKEVYKSDERPDGTYKLTAKTGSLRYMAPEVGNGWPYNFLADSYSYTILLWELITLNQPFESFTGQEIMSMVMKWGERPPIRDDWSDRLKETLKSGWDAHFRKRPGMKDIKVMLELELHDSQED